MIKERAELCWNDKNTVFGEDVNFVEFKKRFEASYPSQGFCSDSHYGGQAVLNRQCDYKLMIQSMPDVETLDSVEPESAEEAPSSDENEE